MNPSPNFQSQSITNTQNPQFKTLPPPNRVAIHTHNTGQGALNYQNSVTKLMDQIRNSNTSTTFLQNASLTRLSHDHNDLPKLKIRDVEGLNHTKNDSLTFNPVNNGNNGTSILNQNTRLSHDFVKVGILNQNNNTPQTIQRFRSVDQKLTPGDTNKIFDFKLTSLQKTNHDSGFYRVDKNMVKSRNSYAVELHKNQPGERSINQGRESFNINLSNSNFKTLSSGRNLQRKMLTIKNFKEQKVDMGSYLNQGFSSQRNMDDSPKIKKMSIVLDKNPTDLTLVSTSLGGMMNDETTFKKYLLGLQENFEVRNNQETLKKSNELDSVTQNIESNYVSDNIEKKVIFASKSNSKSQNEKDRDVIKIYDTTKEKRKSGTYNGFFEEAKTRIKKYENNHSGKKYSRRKSPNMVDNEISKKLKFSSNKKLSNKDIKSRSSSPVIKKNLKFLNFKKDPNPSEKNNYTNPLTKENNFSKVRFFN